MAKTETIHARIEPALKANAEGILHKIGLSMTDAIRMFLRQVEYHRGLPFEARIPNKETIEAMEELARGEGTRMTSTEFSARLQEIQNDVDRQ